MKILRFCLLLALPGLFAQAPPPGASTAAAPAPAPPATAPGLTEEEQATLIKQIRQAALGWEAQTNDFTCNRTSRLEARNIAEVKPAPPKPSAPKTTGSKPASAAGGKVNPAETEAVGPWQTLQLTEDKAVYSGHKDNYFGGQPNAPVAAAVAPAKNAPKPAPPLLDPAPLSAFAGLLTSIFSEDAHAEFTWKGVLGLRGIPVYVLDYKVAKENSTQEITAAGSKVTVGFHGTVYADSLSRRVMSVSFQPETPPEFPEQDVQRLFDFGQVVIAGQFNLLPIKCQMQVRCSLDMLREGKTGGKSPQVIVRMTTDFLSFRKYIAPAAAPVQAPAQ
ncbi:MAG TPA: hypothetical protein VG273_16180 [Bryobacteraceae bacterium]|jgi:hypothetical protein|nr:hypothetical protein [Bryobacteraceae bacterium]